MGREIRRVPGNWQHPKDDNGEFVPLFDGEKYARRLRRWDEEAIWWERGMVRNYEGGMSDWVLKDQSIQSETYEDWAGERPNQNDYMPQWDEKDKTHIMMYETCSEGTPVSPAFETPEDLARWLADNDASAFGNMTATYEQWLSVCKCGSAPSAYINAEGIRPGVAL